MFNNYPEIVTFKLESASKSDLFTYFNCKNRTGTIRPRKKYRITFYFTPQEMGSFEEFFIFTLEEQKYMQAILVAGICREPRVSFARPHIPMEPTVLGVESTSIVKLKNGENIPLQFSFKPESLTCSRNERRLHVTPMSGEIQPDSSQRIK